MNAVFGAIGRTVVRFRWVVIAVWLLGTIAAVHSFPSLGSQVNNNNSDFLPANAASTQAANLAKPLIGTMTKSQVILVGVTSNASLDGADLSALTDLRAAESKVSTVRSVQFIGRSKDQQAEQFLITSSVEPFSITPAKKLVDRLQTALNSVHLPSDLTANMAGQVVTEIANQKQSTKQGGQIQSFSILFILILLVVIFRSLLAPFLTLLGPVFALALSGSFIGELGAHGLKISFFTQILLIILLLGAGTDYGLFLVFRVREELLGGRDGKEAVAVAMARVGESITASAATVIVAMLSLTLASFGIYKDLGIPLAIGIAVMLLAGLTLLPALLAIFGRAVFWPSKTAPREHEEGVWGKIAGRLVQRPLVTLTVGVLAFGALAVFAVGYKSGGFGGKVTAPAKTAAAAGNAASAKHFPQSSTDPTNIVMSFPTSVWNDPKELQTASDGLRASGEFTTIAGPLDPNGTKLTGAQLDKARTQIGVAPVTLAKYRLPQRAGTSIPPAEYDAYVATERFVTKNGTIAQWEVGLRAGSGQSTAATQAIPAIRTAVAEVARRAGASKSGVAGEAAAFSDVGSVSGSDLIHIIPIAVFAIGLVLILVLRSLIAPLYLIVSVVLSYLTALGLSVFIFMDLGHEKGIVFLLPFLMFIFLLALGEDYNILVMTRIREEAHRLPLHKAVVRAVGSTGPTVTSAGLVLAGTFLVLAVVGGSGATGAPIREIGFGLMIGILLDTFVVRTVLVPSVVSIFGKWNWWPSHIDVDEVPAADGKP